MKFNRLTTFAVCASYAFASVHVMAGGFIGASQSSPDLILHPSGYVPGNQNLEVNVCIDPASAVTTDLVIPVQNAIAVFNQLEPTTGNLGLGANNNIPSGALDAESVVLHEIGHCIGLSHVNLATESGLPAADREYTKSTEGNDGTFGLNDGADNIQGSADDIRGDDTNLHYFKMVDNNPFTIAGTIDSSTYSRNLADLPSGNYAANGSRALAPTLGFPNTEAVMQQGQFFDEAQRTLTADGVATLLYGASGVDEVAGTADDYDLTLVYQGITNTNCDVTVVVNNETGFASCSVGFSGVSGDHFRITSGTVRLNDATNWFYNQVPVDTGPTNSPPVLEPIDDLSMIEGDNESFVFTATDPDAGDVLTFALSGAATILCTESSSLPEFTCSAGPGDAGEYPGTFTVFDDGDPILSDSQSFTLTVVPDNGQMEFVQCVENINVGIPDNDIDGLTSTMSILESGQIIDLNVGVFASHTYVGDLIVTLSSSNESTAVVLDRPGVPASTFGCASDNIDALFDDEGTDGVAEDTCNATSPALSGSLIPAELLNAAFGDELITGDWALTISDNAGADTGSLVEWCIEATVIPPTDVDSDGDGVFDSVDNCTLVENPAQIDADADGIGNLCDADFDNNCVVNFLDISAFGPAFNSTTGAPNYNPEIDINSDGAINFIDFTFISSQFQGVPGPSAEPCIP